MASFLAPLAWSGRWHSKLKGSYAIPSSRKTVTTTTSRHARVAAVRSPLPPTLHTCACRPFRFLCAQVRDQCGKRGDDADCFCFALRDESNIDRVLRLRFGDGKGADGGNAAKSFVKVAQEVSRR